MRALERRELLHAAKIKQQDIVTITIEIPEQLAGQLIAAGQDPVRATLEAVALEGYRSIASRKRNSANCSASRSAWSP